MVRWPGWSRSFRNPERRNRCLLALERLEEREVLAADVVYLGGVPGLNEGGVFAFGPAAMFQVNDAADPSGVAAYTATLSAPLGTFDVDDALAVDFGITVGGDGTGTVTLTGQRVFLNALLGGGIAYTGAPFFSGDTQFALAATDLSGSGTSDSESTLARVFPVVSDFPPIGFDPGGDVFVTPAGFGGFEAVPVTPWPDLDGSEVADYFISVSAGQPFRLFANGVEVPPSDGPNFWIVSAANPTAMRALLDSLVLVPPPGFSGRVFVNAFGELTDTAIFSDSSSATDTRTITSGAIALRFFQGTRMTAGPGLAPEGGTIDLAGRFAGSDPDLLPGDRHVLRLTAASGTLAVNAAHPVFMGLTVSASGSAVTLVGNLSAINAALATPGVLTFTADDPFFSGVLPLRVVLANIPGERLGTGDGSGGGNGTLGDFGPQSSHGEAPLAFDALVPMGFAPVAAPLAPTAQDANTDAGVPVALNITVPPVADPDGSESAVVLIGGVPAGAALSAGTNLGAGVWALSPAQLAGLTFIPGTGVSGAFVMIVGVRVLDSAPSLGLADLAESATTFTVTVDGGFGDDDDDDPTDDGTEGAGGESGTSEFVEADDFDTDPIEVDPVFSPASIGQFNLVEVPARTDEAGPIEVGASAPLAPPPVALPSYGDGEKHPLPPVLPLDQSVPVAGFSDSGGDTFALLDRLYREGPVAAVGPGTDAGFVPVDAAPPPRETPAPPAAPDAAAPDAASEGAAAAAPPADEGTDWRVWAGTVALAGTLAAFALYTRVTRAKRDRTARPQARLHSFERTA